MKIKVIGLQLISNIVVSVTCPHCGYKVVFEPLLTDGRETGSYRYFGQRKCTRSECQGHIFFVASKTGEIVTTYPKLSIPFDVSGLPEKVIRAMTEAIECHANECYIASAIMIRKTLEEICTYEECKGKNLFEKLKNLESKITLPTALISGMTDLRLLGNDAAHVEAETYEKIDKEEIEVSLAVTLEILKATYQYQGLIGRLSALKKPTK